MTTPFLNSAKFREGGGGDMPIVKADDAHASMFMYWWFLPLYNSRLPN